jgi:hypothetical protein
MSRQQRTAHARETAQADQAAADRPAAPGKAAPRPAAASPEPASAQAQQPGDDAEAAVVAMRWRDRAGDTRDAVDAERRRRRESAIPSRPEPAPLMREALRRHSMLRIPGEDYGGQGTAAGADQEQA